MRALLFTIAALLATSASACSGCENSVCCSVPSHALPSIVRPTACTTMGGTAVETSMCDAVCCQASDGTLAPSARMSCGHIVEPRLCDTADGG